MININISRKHIISLVFIVAVATFINYTIAQGGVQSHPISEVTNLDANGDGVVDLANNSNYLGGQLPAYYEGGGATPMVVYQGSAADVDWCTPTGANGCTTLCSNQGGKTCAFEYELTSNYVKGMRACTTGTCASDTYCACYS
ncbi:MAG: hypothetical protein KJ928_00150 [Candidatus Altiarchaeota archaeon]|nr:hypothetical protein [Candidatus Altiarchaeota archaeon]MBU4437538.1 hypothetical protein [Candidatus Altiarchaeota archaeon]